VLRAAAREPDDPEERSGLETIERFLVSKYGDKFASRLIVTASVRAVSVLIREHPIIAARLLGVGLARAAKLGLDDGPPRSDCHNRFTSDFKHPLRSWKPLRPSTRSAATTWQFRKRFRLLTYLFEPMRKF
jgi:hypothetical protein